MNKAEKAVTKEQLKDEERALKELKKSYQQARKDVKEQISALKSKVGEFTDFVSEHGLMEAFKEFIRPKSLKEKLEIGKQKSPRYDRDRKGSGGLLRRSF